LKTNEREGKKKTHHRARGERSLKFWEIKENLGGKKLTKEEGKEGEGEESNVRKGNLSQKKKTG